MEKSIETSTSSIGSCMARVKLILSRAGNLQRNLRSHYGVEVLTGVFPQEFGLVLMIIARDYHL